jgi:hypothetical protein
MARVTIYARWRSACCGMTPEDAARGELGPDTPASAQAMGPNSLTESGRVDVSSNIGYLAGFRSEAQSRDEAPQPGQS